MAMKTPGKPRPSGSSKSRLPTREGSRLFRSKSRVKHQCSYYYGRKVVVHGAHKISRLQTRKSKRSSAYRQYGSSSQTATARYPQLTLQDPYQELERSVYGLSKMAISGGSGFYKRPVHLSSDSSEECIADPSQDGGGDLGPEGRQEVLRGSAQNEKNRLDQRDFRDENTSQRPFIEILRMRQTAVMNAIVRKVSPARRLQHIGSKGYFNHDYSQHERTTSDMENLMQGNKKGVQSLYYALGVRPDRNNCFRGRMRVDADFFDSPKCSKRYVSRL